MDFEFFSSNLVAIATCMTIAFTIALGMLIRTSKRLAKAATSVSELDKELAGLRAESASLAAQAAELAPLRERQEDFQRIRGAYEALIPEFESFKEEIADLQDERQVLSKRITILAGEKESLAAANAARKEEFDELHQKFQLQLESLANKVLAANSSAFKKESSEQLGQLLAPLGSRLLEFQKTFLDRFENDKADRSVLRAHVDSLIEAQSHLSTEAGRLASALRGSSKAQGNWGELVLENILDACGLEKDRDYIREGKGLELISSAGDQPKNLRPDVIVRLPENKSLIIDSKVVLTSYQRFLESESDEDKAQARKDYVTAIRTHVNSLAAKKYQNLEGLGSPEFVFMFLPTEGAFSFAMECDSEIFMEAWDKNISIVSPTTIQSSLRAVASIWRIAKQEEQAANIAKVGGTLYDQFVLFVDELKKVGASIDKSKDDYDKAFKRLCQGKRDNNIVRLSENLRELGAKVSAKLPDELILQIDEMALLEGFKAD